MKIVDRDTGRQVADTQDEASQARRRRNTPLRRARAAADEQVRAAAIRDELGWFGRGGGRHRRK